MSVRLISMIILIGGIVFVQQTPQQDSTNSMIKNMSRQVQIGEIEPTIRAGNNLSYSSGDLLYREFSSGIELESGMDVLIERGCITNALGNAVMVGVILNGDVYREIPLEETDIEFTLEKHGNYVFMAVAEDGETVDITSIIKVEKSMDGGVILLK